MNQFSSLAEVYDSLEFQDQRELVRTVLDEVVVGDKWIDYSIYAFNHDFVTTDCTGTHAVVTTKEVSVVKSSGGFLKGLVFDNLFE
ncbi:MAG: hypothetical protein ACRBF0_01695 [Calditrichia bacterium]